MASAATVESTTTATTTTMESAAYRGTVIATASESASHCAAAIAAAVASTVSAAIAITAPVAVPTAIAVAISATIAVHATVSIAIAITITTPEPRAGANEDATAKPRWTVVTIRRSGVGGVAVVSIGADRSRIAVATIHGASYADPDRDLGMRVSRRRDDQHSE